MALLTLQESALTDRPSHRVRLAAYYRLCPGLRHSPNHQPPGHYYPDPCICSGYEARWVR